MIKKSITLYVSMPSPQGLEYIDCIYCKDPSHYKNKGVIWVWHKTASGGVGSVLERREMWSTPSLPLLPGQLWYWMVVSVKVLPISHIDLFTNYLY